MVMAASWAPADHPDNRSFSGSPPSAGNFAASQSSALRNLGNDFVHGCRGRERVADKRDIHSDVSGPVATKAKFSFARICQ